MLRLAPIGWLARVSLVAPLLVPACAMGAASPPCGDPQQNQWLSACAMALAAASPRDHPPATAPWKLSGSQFESAPPLADPFVAACQELTREPCRLAERDRPSLAISGWQPPGRACTIVQHLEWLRSCEADANAIAGHSRRELLAIFAEEGGFMEMGQRNYFHRRCSALKVHATFRPAGDGRSHLRAESPLDVVSQATVYVDPYFVFD
jgi:hypothetical protein